MWVCSVTLNLMIAICHSWDIYCWSAACTAPKATNSFLCVLSIIWQESQDAVMTLVFSLALCNANFLIPGKLRTPPANTMREGLKILMTVAILTQARILPPWWLIQVSLLPLNILQLSPADVLAVWAPLIDQGSINCVRSAPLNQNMSSIFGPLYELQVVLLVTIFIVHRTL